VFGRCIVYSGTGTIFNIPFSLTFKSGEKCCITWRSILHSEQLDEAASNSPAVAERTVVEPRLGIRKVSQSLQPLSSELVSMPDKFSSEFEFEY